VCEDESTRIHNKQRAPARSDAVFTKVYLELLSSKLHFTLAARICTHLSRINGQKCFGEINIRVGAHSEAHAQLISKKRALLRSTALRLRNEDKTIRPFLNANQTPLKTKRNFLACLPFGNKIKIAILF